MTDSWWVQSCVGFISDDNCQKMEVAATLLGPEGCVPHCTPLVSYSLCTLSHFMLFLNQAGDIDALIRAYHLLVILQTNPI